MAFFEKISGLKPYETIEPREFPSISKPSIIGYFSIDGNREYVSDAHNCKYYWRNWQNQVINYDLNIGAESAIHQLDVDVKIDQMLLFIINNFDKLRDENSQLRYQFVCFRGLLRQIMCTPYDNNVASSWIILATKYRGTIYLCAFETNMKKRKKMEETREQKLYCSYGYKFEQYLLTDDPNKPPNTDEPVNENEQFCCVFHTNLKGNNLLYGAEMDGIESDRLINFETDDLNSVKFVELKTKVRDDRENQKRNFLRFKTLNWWCQSFLVKIFKIVIGIRNRSGLVEQIQEIPIRDIPKMAQNYWSPSVAMQFCDDFLKHVQKEIAREDDPYTVYKFECNPTQHYPIRISGYRGKNEYSFLPDWYIDKITSFTTN